MPLWRYLWLGGTRAISVWHRRSGKDEVCLHWAAVSAVRKCATYWHMLPEAAQARKAIWEAINPHTGKRRIDEAFPKSIRANTREQEMMIRFKNGSTWQVVGSDNYDSLVGSPPYGVVFSEWALANAEAWAYLRPILAENGGWAAFVTTPRGKNHAKAMLDHARATPEQWFGELLTATHTGVFTPEQLEIERREYIAQWGESLGNALFEQEYMCSFEGAWPGKLVYANFVRAQHVSATPLVWTGGSLYRGWDNTGNSPACVVVQIPTAGRAQVLREYWSDRLGIVDFTREVKADCDERYPAAGFDEDWADPAGSAKFSKPDGGLTSNAELMEGEGIKVSSSDQALTARIQAVDQAMARPEGLLIDPSAERLIDGFSGGYCYPKISRTEDRYGDKPDKNHFSHCLVGDAKIETNMGQVAIKDVCTDDVVKTPFGDRRIVAVMSSESDDIVEVSFSDGNKIATTGDHPFYTQKGIVRADALRYGDVVFNIKPQGGQTWGDHASTSRKSLKVSSTIKNHQGIINRILKSMGASISTALYGRTTTAQFHPMFVFTTSMGIEATIDYKTFARLAPAHMPDTTLKNLIGKNQRLCSGVSNPLKKQQSCGTGRLEGSSGTVNTVKGCGATAKSKNIIAQFVAKFTKRGAMLSAGFARNRVSKKLDANPGLMTKQEPVLFVGKNTGRTNIQKSEHVESKVAGLRRVKERKRVYDITVEDAHCFYANGVLVGNCHDALQYVMVKLFPAITRFRRPITDVSRLPGEAQ